MKTKYGTAKLNNGYYQITSSKEGNNGKKLHRLIWEDFYCRTIPDGCVIHHMNGDKLDNRIQNLQCCNAKSHARFHNAGKNHPMYGKKNPEHSKRMVGKNNPFYGKHHSEETRKKLSKKHTGKTLSKEHKKHISKATSKENNPRWKNYARVLKTNVKSRGRTVYYIKYNGKKIKESGNLLKLIKWFEKEYSDVKLHNEIKEGVF